jgi:hypothetical protein
MTDNNSNSAAAAYSAANNISNSNTVAAAYSKPARAQPISQRMTDSLWWNPKDVEELVGLLQSPAGGAVVAALTITCRILSLMPPPGGGYGVSQVDWRTTTALQFS